MHMVGTTIRDLTQQTMGFRLRRSLKKVTLVLQFCLTRTAGNHVGAAEHAESARLAESAESARLAEPAADE